MENRLSKFNYAFLILFFPFVLKGELLRRLWMYEFINVVPAVTEANGKRSQIGIRSGLFSNSASGAVVGLISFPPYVELRFQGLERWPLVLPDVAGVTNQMVMVELGKHYVGSSNYFGNFAFGWLNQQPENQNLVSVRIHSGVIDSVEQPWVLGFRIGYFSSVPRTYNVMSVGFETGRTLFIHTTRLRFIGTIVWSYLMSDLTINRSEHISFTLGPAFEVWSAPWRLRLGTGWRISIDREQILNTSGNFVTTFPNLYEPLPELHSVFEWLF